MRAPVGRRRLRSTRGFLIAARKALKTAIVLAKNDWIASYVETMNAHDARGGTVSSWQAVGVLKAGLSKIKKVTIRKMKKPDGSIAESAAENAEVFGAHFKEGIFGREPEGDPSVVDAIPQHAIMWALEDQPTMEEFEKSRTKLRYTAPGKSGLPAAAFKFLDGASSALLYEIVVDVWLEEKQPVEFDIGVLAILPKKGDLSDPGNYRGIMMLEVAYKIVALIGAARLYLICESIDHENQVGFRPKRGCSDGLFNIRMAIKKRREHGCETWVLFLDLVKAFDRVPREMLWRVLAKFGVPPKMIAVLKALHASVHVEFEIDGISKIIESIIGVKQGDVLGPVLFVIYMAAVMMSWRQEHGDVEKLYVYRSRPDFVMTGRKGGRKSDEFVLQDFVYADDTALEFPSREAISEAIPLVFAHFGRWGMEAHKARTGTGKISKSVATFFASNRPTYVDYATYDDIDLSPFHFGENGEFEIPIVDHFKHLGSCVHRDCNDEFEVDSRLKAAGGAFGALSKPIFRSKSVSLRAKRVVYNGVILAILLYGAETWSLTELLFHRLRTFHATCVRAMCLVTKRQVWKERISTKSLEQRLGMQPIDVYVFRRQLAWAGHVSRMGWERIPRKLLSSWVNAPRAACGVEMTYGRALEKAFRRAGLDESTWHERAKDRTAWKAMIKGLS